jgi:hypothetical protein
MERTSEENKKPTMIRQFMKTSHFLRPFLGVVFGGIGGYLYYHYVGCSTGSCAITGNPFMSTLAGSFLGFYALQVSATNHKKKK